jgi:hypothetical protein
MFTQNNQVREWAQLLERGARSGCGIVVPYRFPEAVLQALNIEIESNPGLLAPVALDYAHEIGVLSLEKIESMRYYNSEVLASVLSFNHERTQRTWLLPQTAFIVPLCMPATASTTIPWKLRYGTATPAEELTTPSLTALSAPASLAFSFDKARENFFNPPKSIMSLEPCFAPRIEQTTLDAVDFPTLEDSKIRCDWELLSKFSALSHSALNAKSKYLKAVKQSQELATIKK